MFNKIEGGQKVTLDSNAGYKVDVWIPPLGYGFNTITGEIEKTDIIQNSPKPSEQRWKPIKLPDNFKAQRAKEKERQKGDSEYFDAELEKIREKFWTYRLCGLWVYMNGKPVYITGEHFMYINFWQNNDGLPDYRDADRRRYYFQEFCIHDPRCAGILEGSNRRSGKSYRAGLFLYNYVSMTPDAWGGLQSKTEPDARTFFRVKLVTPFKRLPDFFMPELDTSAGSGMAKEIKFTKAARKGKAAMENINDLGLNSYIDNRASGEYAYDGEALQRAVNDEIGKPSDADSYERWGVIKYCLRVGKKWVGKALLTTTPEELEGIAIENNPFFKIWEESDFLERDKNGHTKSGLYRYFIPAQETIECDKYGMPKIESNLEYILNTREALKGNRKKLLDETKKNCISADEMFKATISKECLFNTEKLSDRLDVLLYSKDHFTRGNFMWEKGDKDTKVVFKKEEYGRWSILNEFVTNFESNIVDRSGTLFVPKNVLNYTMGVDPFDHDNTSDSRRSNGAASVYKKYDPFAQYPNLNNACVCLYLARPSTAAIFYEDMIMTACYFGCDVLFENNKIGIKRYFQERGYEKFFIKLKDSVEFGIPSTPAIKQMMADYIEYHVENFPENLFFKKLVEQLLAFDIKNTEKYDAVMAYGYSLIADKYRMFKKSEEKTFVEISSLLPAYLL